MIHQPKIRLYNFKKSFCDYVVDGSKPNTIRDRRKYPPEPGDILKLYYGLRSAQTTLLRVDECAWICSLAITSNNIIVYKAALPDDLLIKARLNPRDRWLPIDYVLYDTADLNAFAWKDGFRPEGSTKENPTGAHELMMRWWNFTHHVKDTPNLAWAGDIIYWYPTPEGARGGSLYERYNKVHSITKKIIK